MKVSRVLFEDFRGFRQLEVTPAAGLTFIVAMNGTGKTSIVEGLAAALCGLVRGSMDESKKDLSTGLVTETDHRRQWPAEPALPPVAQNVVTLDATIQWDDLDLSWRVRSQRLIRDGAATNETRIEKAANLKPFVEKRDAAIRKNEPLPLFAALRAHRSSLGERRELPSAGPADPLSAERLRSWGRAPKLEVEWYPVRNRWYELELRASLQGERAKVALDAVQRALIRAFDLNEAPHFNADEGDFLIKLPGEGWRSVGLMSDGWRACVATVVAVALRCTEINPAQADAASITPGVLLIDEIEQHLHPSLQLEIGNGLRQAFPLLQIIATTHSPLVLTDLREGESDCVLRLERDENNGAISLARLAIPVGRDAVQVLTGAWFGLASTLDPHTLQLMACHRELLRGGESTRDERKKLEGELRKRVGRYADTSVEELVLSVVAELESVPRFDKLSHAEIVTLREKVVATIKAGLS
jgi:predicted ATP-binding protein involved in virulence